jgi:tetratricopeptide (TPR) repeat protein
MNTNNYNNLQTPTTDTGNTNPPITITTTNNNNNPLKKLNQSPTPNVLVGITKILPPEINISVSGVSLKFLKLLIESSTFPKQDPTSIRCPNQHVLTTFNTPDDTWYCNDCGEYQETNTPLYSCQQCEYDMCTNCMNIRLSPTMTHFVQHVIKPKTKATNESYLEKLSREQPLAVKPTADYFISYVWTYPLQELIAALEYTLLTKQNKQDVYIWLDGLCINQHQQLSLGGRSTPEQLQHIFYECFKTINSFVMVLSNWQDPEYPKRSWCVFEAYMAKKVGMSNIILAMSEEEEESLVNTMIENEIGQQFLHEYFSSVDVESAKAKEPADEQAILQLIREFDVSEVNSVILGNLKQWMVQGGDIALASVTAADSEQAGNVCNSRYMIHRALGEFETALEWAQKCLDIKIKVFGNEHEYVATGYTNVAACFTDLGRFQEALVAIDKSIEIDTKILGPDHPDTINGRSWKANIFQDQGKFEEALVMFDDVLQSRRRVLGEDHADTIYALNYKANSLFDLERHEEALPLYEIVLSNRIRLFGENHPYVASDLSNKARCLQEMERAEEALPLYDQAIAIGKKIYGEIHPSLSSSYGNKAECLSILGRFKEALPLYDQCLVIDMKAYGGENHSTVAVALNNKALCLKSLGEKKTAKELGKKALEIAERVLGVGHPTTLAIFKVWGR